MKIGGGSRGRRSGGKEADLAVGVTSRIASQMGSYFSLLLPRHLPLALTRIYYYSTVDIRSLTLCRLTQRHALTAVLKHGCVILSCEREMYPGDGISLRFQVVLNSS